MNLENQNKYGSNGELITEHFDEHNCDAVEDLMRDSLREGKTISEFLEDYFCEQLTKARSEICGWWLDEMLNAKNPKLLAVQIGLACGAQITAERTLKQWASEFGITKQAIALAVKKIQSRWALRKTRTMRSAAGRKNISKSILKFYRNRKGLKNRNNFKL